MVDIPDSSLRSFLCSLILWRFLMIFLILEYSVIQHYIHNKQDTGQKAKGLYKPKKHKQYQ